jgi:hypothetical protein
MRLQHLWIGLRRAAHFAFSSRKNTISVLDPDSESRQDHLVASAKFEPIDGGGTHALLFFASLVRLGDPPASPEVVTEIVTVFIDCIH